MGFLDKAKKMAEQAQAKLDEAQKHFNDSQREGSDPQVPATEYDEHGRPIQSETPAPTPPSVPGAAAPVPDPAAPVPDPAAPGPDSAAPAPDPVEPAHDPAAPAPGQPPEEDRNNPSYAPPKLSSGDPLEG
jgi:hypothetical protein